MTLKLLATILLSAAAFMAAVRFPLNWLNRWPRLWLRLACLFAILPQLPFIGAEIRGAYRWLVLPGGLHLPSHYLVFIFFMLGAAALSASPSGNKTHKAEIVVLTFAAWLGLLLQPYFWSACAFLGLVLMALAIQGRVKQVLILGAVSVTAIAVFIVSSPYRLERVFGFLHPESDPLGDGFQLLNNLSIIATAQWLGPTTAPFLSHQAYIYGDLALIASRYGLAAASFAIVLLACVVAIGAWRAARQADPRLRTIGMLMSLSLGCWAWYAAAWPLGLVPTTSVPLPFTGGLFATIFAAIALGFIYRATPVAATAPTRSARILMAVIFVCTGLLLSTMWALKPPLTYPALQRGQILDAQGIALTELRQEGRKVKLHYPYGKTLSQVLGLVNIDGYGIEGLELQYERVLASNNGKPGQNLRLSIDLKNQLALEAVLQPYLERYSILVEALVMKPDGAILAAATLPGYDPNHRDGTPLKLMRFMPATDIAQAGPMMLPFYLAQGVETFGVQFIAGSPATANVADKLKTEGLRAALARFEFDKQAGLDFPGTANNLIYGGLRKNMRQNLSGREEKETRLELSEGWGVAPSLIRYATSFTALITGSLPQPRLVIYPPEVLAVPSPIIKPETTAAMRETLASAARRAGHENIGGIWAEYRPKPPQPFGDHDIRYATAALFAPVDKPQHLVFVKLTTWKQLPKDIGLEIGTRLLEAVK